MNLSKLYRRIRRKVTEYVCHKRGHKFQDFAGVFNWCSTCWLCQKKDK